MPMNINIKNEWFKRIDVTGFGLKTTLSSETMQEIITGKVLVEEIARYYVEDSVEF